jgi:hypothetical protein
MVKFFSVPKGRIFINLEGYKAVVGSKCVVEL